MRNERLAWVQPGRASDAAEERSRASVSRPGHGSGTAGHEAPGRARRDELDQHRGLLPAAQHRDRRPARRRPLGAPGRAQRRLRRDRHPPARRRLGRDRRDPGRRRSADWPPRARRGCCSPPTRCTRSRSRSSSPPGCRCSTSPTARPRRCARPGSDVSGCSPRRSPWRSRSTSTAWLGTGSRRSSPRRPTAPTCTASSTTSWCATSSRESSRERYREVMSGPGRPRSRGDHPRLYRDRSPGRPRRHDRPDVRHRGAPRGRRGGLDARLTERLRCRGPSRPRGPAPARRRRPTTKRGSRRPPS